MRGRTLVFTQSARSHTQLAQRCTQAGAQVLRLPLMATEALSPTPEDRQMLAKLSEFRLLVFTSRNGVDGFFDNFCTEFDRNNLPEIACVGAATAEALAGYGCRTHYLNPGTTAEDLAQHLRKLPELEHTRILAVVGQRAPHTLRQQLQGWASVERLEVYSTNPTATSAEPFRQAVEQSDAVLLASPSAVEQAFALYGPSLAEARTEFVSVGRVTTHALLMQGVLRIHQAVAPHDDALWTTLTELFGEPFEWTSPTDE